MIYEDMVRVFRELAYEANGVTYPPKARSKGSLPPSRQKWKSIEELDEYLQGFGGKVKKEYKRKRGYLVVDMNEGMKPSQVIEVPMEFAIKVLVMRGFP